MISTRLVELVIDTVLCLTLAKWETVSGQFGGYLTVVQSGVTILYGTIGMVVQKISRFLSRPRPSPKLIERTGSASSFSQTTRLMLIVVTVAVAMLLDLRVSQAAQMPWCALIRAVPFITIAVCQPTKCACRR